MDQLAASASARLLTMPQVLKEEVRSRILDAALRVFARSGFPAATMSAIAAEADTGAATIYRYYKSKEDLFAAVITPELAREFESLLERRVRALASNAGDAFGDEILRFWSSNRLAIVVLLDRAAGTEYAHDGERFVEQLVKGTLAEIHERHPGLRVRTTTRFVLQRIFENTRRMLAAILEEYADEDAMREAMRAFWSYQIPGLRGLVAATAPR